MRVGSLSARRRRDDGGAAGLGCLLDRGNGEGEPAPQARTIALRPDAAPMGLHDPPADGQAEARPFGVVLPDFTIGRGELPEQAGQALGRYPLALVNNGDRNVAALA